MEDFIKSIKAYLYERVSTPLFTAFCISWIVWNFRLVLIIFSELNINNKLSQIESYFQSTHPILAYHNKTFLFLNEGYIFNTVLMPLSIALIYIIITPILSLPVYRFSLKVQSKMLEIKKKSDSQTVLTNADRAKVYSDLAKAEEKMAQDLERANRKIRALSDELESAKEELQNSNLNESPDKQKRTEDSLEAGEPTSSASDIATDEELTAAQIDIMKFFYDNGIERAHIADIVGETINLGNIHIVRDAINQLREHDYVTVSMDKVNVYINDKGNSYIANHFGDFHNKNLNKS